MNANQENLIQRCKQHLANNPTMPFDDPELYRAEPKFFEELVSQYEIRVLIGLKGNQWNLYLAKA